MNKHEFYEEELHLLHNPEQAIGLEIKEDEAIPVDVYIRNDYDKRIEAGFKLLNDSDEAM